MIAVFPGFKVTGGVIPTAPNREPATEIDEIVTGAVPEELTVTDLVAVVPTGTLPNDTDGVLTVSAAMPVDGESVMLKVLVVPLACAVIVAVWSVVTPLTVALNPVLSAPDLIVTLLGTLTAGLLLCRLTVSLPLVVDVK
jgi:hypothetical protein